MLDLEKVLETMKDVKNNRDCGKLEHSARLSKDGLALLYNGYYKGFSVQNSRIFSYVELFNAVDPMLLIQIGCEELVRTFTISECKTCGFIEVGDSFCSRCGDV